MKCLTSTALSRASSGGAIVTTGSARKRDRRSGKPMRELAGRHARGQQHRQLVLAHQVEQMKQQRARRRCRHGGPRPAARCTGQPRPRPPRAARSPRSRAAPDFRRQTLARCVLPARGGRTTTATEAWGQCGQRSMMSAAARLDWLMRKSSAPSAGRCGKIEYRADRVPDAHGVSPRDDSVSPGRSHALVDGAVQIDLDGEAHQNPHRCRQRHGNQACPPDRTDS